MEMKGIDLTKCRYFGFKANIDGTDCVGRIQVEEGQVYLCQNIKEGAECNDKLGFKYSLLIRTGSPKDLKGADVRTTDFEIIPRDPETYKDWQVGDTVKNPDAVCYIGRVIFVSGDFVAIETDGHCVCYTREELFNEGYRLVINYIEKRIIEERKPKPYEFRKGEPVLVRNFINEPWELSAFIEKDDKRVKAGYPFGSGPKYRFNICLPYNKKTMYLLGTTEDYNEER